MFFLLTVILGWLILDFSIGEIEILFDLAPGTVKDFLIIYIVIGYIVMSFYNIKSPLLITKEGSKENPLFAFKNIELGLFFKDIYYAIWWPYYIIRNFEQEKDDKNNE